MRHETSSDAPSVAGSTAGTGAAGRPFGRTDNGHLDAVSTDTDSSDAVRPYRRLRFGYLDYLVGVPREPLTDDGLQHSDIGHVLVPLGGQSSENRSVVRHHCGEGTI